MFRKLRITLFCCICSTVCIAQKEWAPVGAKWYYSPWCMLAPMSCAYYSFESIKDTFLLGKNARVLQYTYNGVVDSGRTQIMYGDSDKVYHYFGNEFYVLYDFSAKQGDTLVIKTGPFANLSSTDGAPDSSKLYKQIVDSVGTININGKELRKLYSKPISYYDSTDISNGFFYWMYWGEIIERIGNTSAMFGHSQSFVATGYEGGLRCYQDSVLYYKPYTNDCNYISGIDDKELVEVFNIYPNPAHSFINIEIKTENIKNKRIDFKIIDVLGRMVSENKLTGESNRINISDLNNGMYLILINVHENKTMKLFMKQ